MAEMLRLSTLSANPKRYHLIDVRDAEDYASARVNGAVHIPLVDLETRAAEIPKDKVPVTICGKGGGRSAEGAALLRELGHPGALWLEGGTDGWLASNA